MDVEKPGYLTTEFWIVVIANVLTQLKTLPFPSKYNGIVLAASLLGYSLSRGLAKLGNKGKVVNPTAYVAAPPVPDQGDSGKA